jgi:predicted metal-binding protein
METVKASFKKYLFVCENKRDEGACCGAPGERLREKLKAAVQEKGLSRFIRVSRSGCLDVCAEGPNVLLMPDNIWFKHVSENDVEEIIEKAGF